MVDPVAVGRDEALFLDIGIDVVRPHSPSAPQAKRGNVAVPQEIAHVVLTEPQPMRDVRHLDQARAGKQGVEGHQGSAYGGSYQTLARWAFRAIRRRSVRLAASAVCGAP